MTGRRRYSGRHVRAVVSAAQRKADQKELLAKLTALEPRAVFGGCLDYAVRCGSKKADGYAANIFREMFGAWPQPRDRGPPAPLPDFPVDRWVALRRGRVHHIRAEKPAPLLAPLEPGHLQIDGDGFTSYTDPITGEINPTLMRPQDWEEDWR